MTRFVSLFAGMGGGDLGLELSGMECVAQVENDRACNAVLEARWPGVPRWGDIAGVHGADLPPAELVIFGSPCQGLSVAGQRRGLRDARSGLFFEAARIIREMREATDGRLPILALWENVPGAKSSNLGRDFAAALNALAECGAVDLAWRVINAEHWVPQRRRRVFTLACFPPYADGGPGVGRAAAILALTEGMYGHPAPCRAAGQDIAACLTSSVGDRREPSSETYVVSNGQSDPSWDIDRSLCLDTERPPAIAFNHQWGGDVRLNASTDHAPALQRNQVPAVATFQQNSMGGRGTLGYEQHTEVLRPVKPQSDHQMLVFDLTQITSRENRSNPQPNDPSHPLAASARAPYLTDGYTVRRLTPLECLRLQGFPDGWFDGLGLSDTAQYRMCGNAMAVPVLRWLGERIVAFVSEALGYEVSERAGP